MLAIDCNDSTVAVALWATRSLLKGERLAVRIASEHAAILNPLTSILSAFKGAEAHSVAASMRDARESKIFRVATFAYSVFHHPHETFFDSTRFRRVTRYDGAGRDEF